MDVNGTRLHLLLGRGDWGRCREPGAAKTLGELWPASGISAAADASWDPELEELRLRPQPAVFERPGEGLLDPSARRGIAVDRFGNWFWISADRLEIRVASGHARVSSLFWRPGVGAARRSAPRRGEFARAEPDEEPLAGALLGGLAVTADHHLVAGLLEPAGLLVFDLQGGGAPLRFVWPSGVGFAPFAMSARRRGGVFVLDAANARLWELDRHFEIVSIGPGLAAPPAPAIFGPEGSARSAVSGPIRREDAAALEGEPIGLAAARDGTVLVLDRNAAAPYSLLRRYRNGAVVGAPVQLVADELGLSVRAHDIALASEDLGEVPASLGRLYAVAEGGNQAYAFRVAVPGDQLTLAAYEGFFPLRSFGGKGLASDGRRPYYDSTDRVVPLVEQPRPSFISEAVIITPSFDGGEPDCVWHRLMLDGCIPPEAAVAVSSRTADDPRLLASAPWRAEPVPQRRVEGSELPFVDAPATPRGTWELLFQHARGRHLQLRLRLSGDGRTSPRLRALRAHYPRFSYLDRYLPKVYREDDVSASFLDRFLANVEGINTAIEERIATAQILFDPDATPLEHLDWLAGWFELVLGADWSEAKRRLFVRNARAFLDMRGTARGLLLALRLALEPCVDQAAFSAPEAETGGPRIVERFRTRTLPAAALADGVGASGPQFVEAGRRWRPSDGADALDARYGAPFPALEPAEGAAAWRAFAQSELGFVPEAGGDAWTAFLRARYRRIELLRSAYGLGAGGPKSFAELTLTATLPDDGPALRDWYQFQAVLVPMWRAAHAFTVLLPVPVGEPEGVDLDARRALAERVVSLQKPAHTVFDVRFFWSAFRVGEARLGRDTVVELGSRSPALLSPFVLGRGHLGEDVLGGDAAPRLAQPPSLGRQPLGR